MFLLFHGPDDFSAHEALAQLRASDDFDTSQDTLYGAEVSLDTIRTLCDTFPFLSEKRLVVVDGLPKRKRAGKDDSDEAASPGQAGAGTPPAPARPAKGKRTTAAGADPKAFAQGLAEYAARLPETTVLAVLVDEVLDDAHPLLQAARRYGTARLFVAPRGAQLTEWLARRVRASGAGIAPDAARLLVSGVGSDLRLLASEVDKLATYVGAGGQIGVEDVRQLASTSQQARVFDLTDALARRDRSRALALLHELLAGRASAPGIPALTAFPTRAPPPAKSPAQRRAPAPPVSAPPAPPAPPLRARDQRRDAAVVTSMRARRKAAPLAPLPRLSFSLESRLLVGICLLALALRLWPLGGFSTEYDEGVYWQSLRALADGHALFSSVFSSQPPFFLLSLFPLYLLFGQTLAAARLAIVIFSLAGIVAIYSAGAAIGGRWAGLAASPLLARGPRYLTRPLPPPARNPPPPSGLPAGFL